MADWCGNSRPDFAGMDIFESIRANLLTPSAIAATAGSQTAASPASDNATPPLKPMAVSK